MKEIEAGRGELRLPHAARHRPVRQPRRTCPGEPCEEPTFGLPALWIEERLREEALARGCTVVDGAGVLATHLTELVREHMAELLSHAETQKLLDDLPPRTQKLVADLIPAQISDGQRAARAPVPAGGARLHPRPADHPGRASRRPWPRARARVPGMTAVVRDAAGAADLDAARGPGGYVPMISLSAEWEQAFAESLIGPGEERQLAMAPSRLQEFMHRVRDCLRRAPPPAERRPCSCAAPGVRAHVRAIVERFRPSTAVLAQSEIHPRARIRTVGAV